LSAAAPDLRDGIPIYAPELVGSDEGMDRSSFELLARVEAGHFWFRARNRLIAWALDAYFPEARSLLEVGCGTGFVLSGLRHSRPAMRMVGGEPALEALAYARRRLPYTELVQLDGRDLPFHDEFDVVGAFDVIEHIDEDERALASIRDAARPRGGVILTVPQHRWLWSAHDTYSHHQRRYTRRELTAKLRRAGLELLRTTSFVSIPLPLMYLSRLRKRGPVESFDPMDEFSIPAPVNAALERVMGLELALIRRGVSLPAGGTLLAVARKR
jgi:SAM-dependent methyltransferase